MGKETTRWTIDVEKAIDVDLRNHLAEQGMQPEDLASFVQEAVRWRLFDLSLAEFRKGFEGMSPDEVEELVDEAVAWARANPEK